MISDEIAAKAIYVFETALIDMSDVPNDPGERRHMQRRLRAAIEAIAPAIRAEAFEKAANHVARFTPSHDDCHSDYTAGYRGGHEDAAAAIRAMAEKEGAR